jgi:signal peptidase I
VKSEKHNSKKPPASRKNRIQREVITWMWLILVFMLVNGTIGQARVIPSGSMENTLLVGDHLIMSRIGYDAGVPFTKWHVPLWRNPQRQQMVIFRPPIPGDSPDWVKRVIGLPGDTVDIHGGAVYINGQKLVEKYTTGPSEAYEMHTPYKVPPNCYFVMGDNRGDSYDSRFVGCVPRRNLIGTPVMIYMSLNASPDAWESGQIRERILAYGNAVLHPSLIRWKRLFHIF